MDSNIIFIFSLILFTVLLFVFNFIVVDYLINKKLIKIYQSDYDYTTGVVTKDSSPGAYNQRALNTATNYRYEFYVNLEKYVAKAGYMDNQYNFSKVVKKGEKYIVLYDKNNPKVHLFMLVKYNLEEIRKYNVKFKFKDYRYVPIT